MDELKPCPFCGSDELSHGWSAPGYDEVNQGIVQCHNCDAIMLGPHEREAIAAWNTRPEVAAAPTSSVGMDELIARLRASIERSRREWFCSGHDCEAFDHGRDEGFDLALKAFDAALTTKTDTTKIEKDAL